jgi:hypothetical protein
MAELSGPTILCHIPLISYRIHSILLQLATIFDTFAITHHSSWYYTSYHNYLLLQWVIFAGGVRSSLHSGSRELRTRISGRGLVTLAYAFCGYSRVIPYVHTVRNYPVTQHSPLLIVRSWQWAYMKHYVSVYVWGWNETKTSALARATRYNFPKYIRHGLRVFENTVLRLILGPRRDERIGIWSKLHNVELHNWYFSPDTIVMIKSKKMRLMVM